MNSGLEKKLSMDELMEKNRPAHTPQSTPSNVVIQCPMPEALDRLEHRLRCLEGNSYSQAEYLRQLTEMRGWLPTRMQVDELTKAVAELRWAVDRVGNQNEKSFSLPKLKLPRPHLPRLSPAFLLILAVLAALWVMWYSLDALWNGINMLNT